MKEAIQKLKSYEFGDAYKLIISALSMNPHAPEPHNLLGLWYEMKGNDDIARKHYRAAYALDPTYKPASKNLERVSTLFSCHSISFDFGDDVLEVDDLMNQEWESKKRIFQSMSLNNENLQLLEVKMENGYRACGKQIMDLSLPPHIIIGCIVRGSNTIVPNGRTEIRLGDQLMIFANALSQDNVISELVGK
jgi:uncharacterized protein YunC (DUF1805 family)